jgi:hypothetical protein
MSKNIFRSEIISITNLASAPANPIDGMFYYDSTLDQFRAYMNGAWGNIAGSAFDRISANEVQLIAQAGVPSSPANGMIYYSSSLNKFQGYINGSFQDLDPAIFTSAKTFQAAAEFQNTLILDAAIDSTTTGVNAIVALPSKTIINFTNASLTSVGNIVAPAAGKEQFLIIKNGKASGSLFLINDASGVANDRIITGSGSDLELAAGASVILYRDENAARWSVVGGVGSGGGGGSIVRDEVTGQTGSTVTFTDNYTAGQATMFFRNGILMRKVTSFTPAVDEYQEVNNGANSTQITLASGFEAEASDIFNMYTVTAGPPVGSGGGVGIDSLDSFLIQKKQNQTFARSPNSHTIVDALTENNGLVLSLAKDYSTSDTTTIYLHENMALIDNMNAVTGWTTGTNTPTIALDTTNKIEGTGSVTMTKASLNGTMSMFKSLAFSTTRRAFRVWVRLDTIANLAANAVRILLESSSGNHKTYSFASSRFTAGGWVLLECDEVDGVATGTPNMASITKVTFEVITSSAQTIVANFDYLVSVTNQDLINGRYAGLTMPIWDATNQAFMVLSAENSIEKGRYTMQAALPNNYTIATAVSKDYGVSLSGGFGNFETATGVHAKTQYIMNRQLTNKIQADKTLQTKIGVVTDSFEAYDAPSTTSLRISGDYTGRFKSGDRVVLWYMASESFSWLSNVQAEYLGAWDAAYKVLTLSGNSTYSAPYTTLTFSGVHSVTDLKNLSIVRIPVIAKGFVGTATSNEVLTDLTLENFYPSARQQLFFDNFDRANNSTNIGGNWNTSVFLSEAGFTYGIDNNNMLHTWGNARTGTVIHYPTINNTLKQKFFEINTQIFMGMGSPDTLDAQFCWGSSTPSGLNVSGVPRIIISCSGGGTNIYPRLYTSTTLQTGSTLTNYQNTWLNVKIVVRDTRVFCKIWKTTDVEPSTWNIDYTGLSWASDTYWGYYTYGYAAAGSGISVRMDNFRLSHPDNNGFQFYYEEPGKTGNKMVIAAAIDRQDTTNDAPAITSVVSTLV